MSVVVTLSLGLALTLGKAHVVSLYQGLRVAHGLGLGLVLGVVLYIRLGNN